MGGNWRRMKEAPKDREIVAIKHLKDGSVVRHTTKWIGTQSAAGQITPCGWYITNLDGGYPRWEPDYWMPLGEDVRMNDGEICYTVTVDTDVAAIGPEPTFTIYWVLTDSEEAPIKAVKERILATWSIIRTTRTSMKCETIDRLGMRLGEARQF